MPDPCLDFLQQMHMHMRMRMWVLHLCIHLVLAQTSSPPFIEGKEVVEALSSYAGNSGTIERTNPWLRLNAAAIMPNRLHDLTRYVRQFSKVQRTGRLHKILAHELPGFDPKQNAKDATTLGSLITMRGSVSTPQVPAVL